LRESKGFVSDVSLCGGNVDGAGNINVLEVLARDHNLCTVAQSVNVAFVGEVALGCLEASTDLDGVVTVVVEGERLDDLNERLGSGLGVHLIRSLFLKSEYQIGIGI